MTYTTLILALILIESSGDDSAIGDKGKAYGCLQLHADYVADAAEYAGEAWVHEDAFDRRKAIKIFEAYMARYATSERLGREITTGVFRIESACVTRKKGRVCNESAMP